MDKIVKLRVPNSNKKCNLHILLRIKVGVLDIIMMLCLHDVTVTPDNLTNFCCCMEEFIKTMPILDQIMDETTIIGNVHLLQLISLPLAPFYSILCIYLIDRGRDHDM